MFQNNFPVRSNFGIANLADQKWTLLTIDDSNFLPGKSVTNMINICTSVVKLNFVILNQIYGTTEAIASLEKQENNVLNIKDIESDINKVKQFDWGDFFLFSNYPSSWQPPQGVIYYPDLVSMTDTTIRAVDDQYLYVYTPDFCHLVRFQKFSKFTFVKIFHIGL